MNKRGFTLVEIVVVIAVLGILVLLAAPKLLGFTEKAKVAQIKNDVEAYERQIASMGAKDPEFLDSEYLYTDSYGNSYDEYVFNKRTHMKNNDGLSKLLRNLRTAEDLKIYDETGLVAIMEDEYETKWTRDNLKEHQSQLLTQNLDLFTFHIPEVKSKLKAQGIFISNSEGEVFYLQNAKFNIAD